MLEKIQIWASRYLPAEITGLVFAGICMKIASLMSPSAILIGFIFTFGENIGYYGFIFLREIWRTKKSPRTCLSAMTFEFGTGEILDSLIIRPLLIAILPIFFAVVLSNLIFYILTISFYEHRKYA